MNRQSSTLSTLIQTWERHQESWSYIEDHHHRQSRCLQVSHILYRVIREMAYIQPGLSIPGQERDKEQGDQHVW
jgi:hypothetical protein